MEGSKSSLWIAGLVLLVIGLVLLFLPVVCLAGIPLAVIGFILLIVGLATHEGTPQAMKACMSCGQLVAAGYVVCPYCGRNTAPMGYPGAPGPSPVSSSANCPRCGSPLTWLPQYRRWYCAPEQAYV